ncbi:MAG: MFS transporter [Spirochaetales bacterium]|nr:MFS transporter [Spirochaetales bacterium]
MGETKNRTIYLSRSERRIGGRRFLQFSGFNGFGISFLGDTTVTLLAIHFGAGNTVLGLLSAMVHISGIILLIIPRLFRGRNVVTVGFWAWVIRGMVCLPFALLLVLEGQAAVALIMVVYALFCLCRTTGIAMVNTIQKRLMISRTMSDMVFRNASSFQGSQILARFLSYLALSLKGLSELFGLLLLPAVGLVFNTAAAFTFRRIPNRTRVDWKKGENLFVILKNSLAQAQSRRVLLVRWITLAQSILFAMVIPFLRRSANITPGQIFLYIVSVSLAAFFSSITLRSIAIRAGSRPLLFFTAIPGAICFLIWIIIPTDLGLAAYCIMGFVTMYLLNASSLAVSRLLIGITPDQGAVGFNSMETFVTSILAISLGIGAGLLADLSQTISQTTRINSYGLVFLPAALGFVVQMILAYHIKELGGMGLKESAKIITNISNLRTWQTVANLETTANPVKRKTLIRSVGHSLSPVSAKEIQKILAEPLSMEKGELIEALFLTKRPQLLPQLLNEAADPASFHRERAIFALGAYPHPETHKLLGQLLKDPHSRVRSTAAKSLGRIGDKEFCEDVKWAWNKEQGIQERLDYMIALFHMDKDRQYLKDLFSQKLAKEGSRVERTFFTLVSQQFGMSPSLGVIYREELLESGRGLAMLLEEARETAFLLEKEEEMLDLWMRGEHESMWLLCHTALADVTAPQELHPLIHALRSVPPGHADRANALAALYFTYQILTSEATQ